MKFAAPAKDLKKALDALNSIIEKRNTIPVLANVMIVATGRESIKLAATDLDIFAEIDLLGSVEVPGSITAAADLLKDIAGKVDPGAVVNFNLANEQLSVHAAKSRFKLLTLPTEDFPEPPKMDAGSEFSMPGADLLRALSAVSHCISTEETRYYLNGVHVHPTDVEIVFVATDGHRLGKIALPLPAGAESLPPIIVSRKTVREIEKIAKDAGDGLVKIKASANRIAVSFGKTNIVSKLIDGTFPDYRRVIPASSNNVAHVSIEALARMTDRVSTIASQKGRGVRFEFDPAGKLAASVVSSDNGSADEEVEIDFAGSPTTIGFNARYLLDLLAQIDGAEVSIGLKDAGSPTTFEPRGKPGALYVLMPMRVA